MPLFIAPSLIDQYVKCWDTSGARPFTRAGILGSSADKSTLRTADVIDGTRASRYRCEARYNLCLALRNLILKARMDGDVSDFSRLLNLEAIAWNSMRVPLKTLCKILTPIIFQTSLSFV